MHKKAPSSIQSKENVSAGIGGAAGGTGLIGIVSVLKLSPEIQQAMFLITPWVSLGLAMSLNWLLKKLKYVQQEKLIDDQLVKARAHRDEILSDENTPEEEKVKVNEWYASLMKYKRQFHEQVLTSLSKDVDAVQVDTNKI